MNSDVVGLRDLANDDAHTLKALADNKLLWLNLRDRFPHPYTISDAKWYINYVLTNEVEVVKGITTNGQLAGVIGVILKDDVSSHVGEIGYWLGESYWGKGIMSHAIASFIKFSEEALSLKRLEASVFSNNAASMRVLEKNGFLKEGIRTSRIIKNGDLLDEHMFGLNIGREKT